MDKQQLSLRSLLAPKPRRPISPPFVKELIRAHQPTTAFYMDDSSCSEDDYCSDADRSQHLLQNVAEQEIQEIFSKYKDDADRRDRFCQPHSPGTYRSFFGCSPPTRADNPLVLDSRFSQAAKAAEYDLWAHAVPDGYSSDGDTRLSVSY
eukprot:GILK01000512.1.p1 GENE.GILK01000512.1~~GILK01000512.1.p1  ORF type:complete len:150 (+),score=19.75 GILK01000512.1:156-605(+)